VAILGTSPVAELGPAFGEDFYYHRLVKDGLIHCDLYRHAGKFVGFSSYTSVPFTFMMEGLKSHPIALTWSLMRSLAQKPKRFLMCLNAYRQQGTRSRMTEDTRMGEILSLGVLPEGTRVIDAATGLRSSRVLFEEAKRFLANDGCESLIARVAKDNRLSQFFFGSLGAYQFKEIDAAHCLWRIDFPSKPAVIQKA
jgi:hypothetical protein